ncbi:MAG: DUF4258 domain-containing protein [Thermoplasmatales archaeon]|nr:DUF4258 domain-containing protein [Thermoplasmatales archaeon]
MNIEIIPLALKKMKLRKIPVEWVKETVESPDQIVSGYMGRRVFQRIYHKEAMEMLLRVICDEIDNKKVVITAYLTSQIDRYWREEK